MKLFAGSLIAAKLLLVTVFAFLYSSDQTGFSADAAASPTPTAPADSVTRPTSEPYTGTLDIFEEPERDKNLQVNRVMDELAIQPGNNVADIGAGSGWFTVRAARRTGEKGKVYAVEINQQYIDYINERAKKEKLGNIQTVLGTPDDPMLAPSSLDAVLILKTYHEIAEPVKLMKNLRASLKKGALVGIIDRSGNGDDHGIARDTIVSEAARAGYALKKEFDFVKGDGMDYFLIFEAK
ncbi:MAG: class I SAM-dependent methyltransferase [Acidobacteria bacterium]|nr:class I SAM-dependent methyltransferase [Acidobacteriota bacterium]MCA1609126.1 class I SAM-dependent methyltransferase [Acidobacteriota bacterium]